MAHRVDQVRAGSVVLFPGCTALRHLAELHLKGTLADAQPETNWLSTITHARDYRATSNQ
jgi:hypothetical protein